MLRFPTTFAKSGILQEPIFDTPQPSCWGFLLQPSSLDTQMRAFKYPHLDTSTSAHAVPDRVWKALFNTSAFTPTFVSHCGGEPVLQEGFPPQATGERVPRHKASGVQDLGFILPGFWIRSCPLDRSAELTAKPTSSFLCAHYRYIYCPTTWRFCSLLKKAVKRRTGL